MNKDYVCIVGLDEPEYSVIREHLDMPMLAYDTLPKIKIVDGHLYIQAPNSMRFVSVSKMVYHGIFDDDFDFITGLALWGGWCLPSAKGMMDCRLKFPCLVRALEYSRFALPQRSYALADVQFDTEIERVAKWGHWHCGENKARFTEKWIGEQATIIEPFISGQAVRLMMIGDSYW